MAPIITCHAATEMHKRGPEGQSAVDQGVVVQLPGRACQLSDDGRCPADRDSDRDGAGQPRPGRRRARRRSMVVIRPRYG